MNNRSTLNWWIAACYGRHVLIWICQHHVLLCRLAVVHRLVGDVAVLVSVLGRLFFLSVSPSSNCCATMKIPWAPAGRRSAT